MYGKKRVVDDDVWEQKQVEKTTGGADLGQGKYYEFSFVLVEFWMWKARYTCGVGH